jgi:hypothetical protein
MSDKTPDRLKRALNLRRAVVNDALEITPEQAEDELIALGRDPKDVAAASRAMTMELLAQSRKSRLHKAKEIVAARRTDRAISKRDVEAVRRALARLAARPGTIAGKRIALAYRNSKGQSEQDALSLWQDLVDLGAVSDDELTD